MEKAAIKDLIYGGICEMMRNRRYYYRSSVGNSYSHWTEEGKAVMERFVNDMSKYVAEAEDASLDERAKNLVLKELQS